MGEVKPLEVTTENPTTSMAEEIERLKEQHRLQLEEHQLNSERTLERIKKSMEEKMEKDKSDMAKEVQEMRKSMEQSLTSRLNSASSHGLNPQDSQENPGTSGSQNE